MRTPTTFKSGRTLYLTPEMRKFKRRTIKLTQDFMVYSLFGPPTLLKAGTVLKTAPLYPEHPGLALGDAGDVNVRLSANTSVWVPAGSWE